MRQTAVFLCFAFAITSLSVHARPAIGVTPPEVIEGDPIHIVVTGLQAGQTVMLRASQRVPGYPTGEQAFRGSALFVADANGVVDLQTSQPLAGSAYDRPDAAGLFW